MVAHAFGIVQFGEPRQEVKEDDVAKKRALIGPASVIGLPAAGKHPQEHKGDTERDIIGRPYRLEIPWAHLTSSQVRALAKDMQEAWSIVEALTHRDDLTPFQMLMRCRSAVRDGAARLPKRSGGRPQKIT